MPLPLSATLAGQGEMTLVRNSQRDTKTEKARELLLVALAEGIGKTPPRQMNQREKRRLEDVLLQRIKEHKSELESMLRRMSDHWTYEDPVYRFYHQSFKVYEVQEATKQAADLLKGLLPEQTLNPAFGRILADGTGRKFDLSHNETWESHTRPLLEAFFHSRFMIEMAVRYADLEKPPETLPSGWAALLYLFNLR